MVAVEEPASAAPIPPMKIRELSGTHFGINDDSSQR